MQRRVYKLARLTALLAFSFAAATGPGFHVALGLHSHDHEGPAVHCHVHEHDGHSHSHGHEHVHHEHAADDSQRDAPNGFNVARVATSHDDCLICQFYTQGQVAGGDADVSIETLPIAQSSPCPVGILPTPVSAGHLARGPPLSV